MSIIDQVRSVAAKAAREDHRRRAEWIASDKVGPEPRPELSFTFRVTVEAEPHPRAVRPQTDQSAHRSSALADVDPPLAKPAPKAEVPSAPDLPRLAYRVEEAASLIGVGRSKIWALIQEGRLAARKIGSSTIILRSDLEAFLASTPLAEATRRARAKQARSAGKPP